MKLVWLVNITLPVASVALGLTPPNTGGWLSGQLGQLDKTAYSITVVSFSFETTTRLKTSLDGVDYIVLPHANEPQEQEQLEELLNDLQPDLLHIHGTELRHVYSALQLAHCPTLLSMQGFAHLCAEYYYADLPEKYHTVSLAKRVLRLLTKPHSEVICEEKRQFEYLGAREKQVLRLGQHFIGRTHWDEQHLKALNPHAKYYKCGEILRGAFYDAPQWNYENCTKHRIFISQGNSPIKGLHILLQALVLVKKEYPDVSLYLTGTKPLSHFKNLKERLLVPIFDEYPAYIARLLRTLKLDHDVHYLGSLNEFEMREQYLKSNVYVLASSIENSPNSLAEAMMLGVPCLASNVGGVSDMLQHESEGLLHSFGDVNTLAHHICRMFAEKDSAARYGENARSHAEKTHCPRTITNDLMQIYQTVLNAQ